jgi:N-acetylneuraminic acid mutarotase
LHKPSIFKPLLKLKTMKIPCLCFLLSAFCIQFPAAAQSTAFTYQGRLNDDSIPATGLYDLNFSIFTNPEGFGGGQLLSLPATPVSNGLFTVVLDFGSSWLTGPDRWLQIGVRTNGSTGPFVNLLPRQRLTSAPFAWRSAVANSLPVGTVTSAMLADGAITSSKLAPGAVVSSLASEGLTAVATDQSVVMSTLAADGALTGRGYVRSGSSVPISPESWTPVTVPGAANSPLPLPAYSVWTGTEFLIVGYGGDGGRYNPTANIWTPIAAPAGWGSFRNFASVAWTGTEMILWGGFDSFTRLNTGFRFNPASGIWTAMRADGTAPSPRDGAVGVWTGSRFVVWGGRDGTNMLKTGGCYDPQTDTWTATRADATAPLPAFLAAAVWTGTRMLVWSGYGTNWTGASSGGSYDPVADTWSAINTNGAPQGAAESACVWTGSKLIVWGGSTNSAYYVAAVNSGGVYDPVLNSWSPMTGIPPSARMNPIAVWTGNDMIVWGGDISVSPFNATDGKLFSPTTGWGASVATSNAPASQSHVRGAWMPGGSELLVVGSASAKKYKPATTTWSPVPAFFPTGQAHRDHVSVWTGSEMLVWGGLNNGTLSSTGLRYNPNTGFWTNLSTLGAPSPRRDFSAVWSGSELIVWGGTADGWTPLADGARYNPANDTWTAMALPPNSPQTPWGNSLREGRFGHTAVWTPAGMFVWGGADGYDNQGSELSTFGAFYQPGNNSWFVVNSADSDLPGRWKPQAAFIFPKIYLIGGSTLPPHYPGGTHMADAISYDLEQDAWASLPAAPQTLARDGFTLTATGNRLALWGGRTSAGTALQTGVTFNPTNSLWTPLAGSNAPVARSGHTAVWSGRELLVWGGVNGAGTTLTNGARVELDAGQWNTFTNTYRIANGHSAVWTGQEMILYGNLGDETDKCVRYRPAINGYYYLKP